MTLFERLVKAPGGLEWLQRLTPHEANLLLHAVEFVGPDVLIDVLREELSEARHELSLLRALAANP